MSAIFLLSLGLFSGWSISAQAQNLVVNPSFANGLSGYDSCCATPTSYNGKTAVLIQTFGGYVSQNPLSATLTSGASYIFSFLAAAQDSGSPATIVGQFNGMSVFATVTSTDYTQYSVTGTAGSNNYFVLQSLSDNGIYVTDLDLEAAPAPLPGGGVISFCALFAGLAAYRMRAKIAARAID